jgi:predicted permease
VTEIIVCLGTPFLVFTSLASRPLLAGDIAVLVSGVVIIFAGVGLLIRLYFLVFQFHSRGFALPALFMNAGNMGIPLALFAFGPPRHAAGNVVGADGINRQVLLLYGSLPAAAMNFILTEKFGQDPNLAASIVVLSTFFSVITIPLVLWLIL